MIIMYKYIIYIGSFKLNNDMVHGLTQYTASNLSNHKMSSRQTKHLISQFLLLLGMAMCAGEVFPTWTKWHGPQGKIAFLFVLPCLFLILNTGTMAGRVVAILQQ